MIEYENLCYLDLQKTATTSISQFLFHYVDERQTVHGGHSSPRHGHDTTKFHFISIREPSALYRSLYLYTCGSRRGLYTYLEAIGRGGILKPTSENFHAWLDFMLDPEQVGRVQHKVNKLGVSEHCGWVTGLMLLISTVQPKKGFKPVPAKSREELRRYFDRERLFRYYVRIEHLAQDLFAVMTADENKVKLSPPLTDLEDLRSRIPKRNVSKKVGTVHTDPIPSDLMERIRDREWLIYEVFGYGETPDGGPPLVASAGCSHKSALRSA
jgi:hypothetical protein